MLEHLDSVPTSVSSVESPPFTTEEVSPGQKCVPASKLNLPTAHRNGCALAALLSRVRFIPVFRRLVERKSEELW
jgi:hypothetical protein